MIYGSRPMESEVHKGSHTIIVHSPPQSFQRRKNQVIPGNDQNTIPTNQGATGSKLDRTS